MNHRPPNQKQYGALIWKTALVCLGFLVALYIEGDAVMTLEQSGKKASAKVRYNYTKKARINPNRYEMKKTDYSVLEFVTEQGKTTQLEVQGKLTEGAIFEVLYFEDAPRGARINTWWYLWWWATLWWLGFVISALVTAVFIILALLQRYKGAKPTG